MSTRVVRNLVAGATIAAMLGAFVPVLTLAAPSGPTVTLSSVSAQAPTATSDNPIMVTAVFSEPVSDFTLANAGNIAVSGGSVTSVTPPVTT